MPDNRKRPTIEVLEGVLVKIAAKEALHKAILQSVPGSPYEETVRKELQELYSHRDRLMLALPHEK